MPTVIRAENIGKLYRINHEAQGQSFRYKTLGETLANAGKAIWRGIARPGKRKDTNPREEDFWALKNINFEILQGDRVGIIGRNGAGKSTLLKILSRITPPTTGKVSIKGRVASLLEVGTGFHPELTGRENVFLNGAILGMRKHEIKRKFDEIVEFAEVEKFLDTPVKHYSSGMYVRLAFAVAAHLEPEILVVDEVLAVGDAQFQKKCLGKMQNVSSHGRTVIFVSHNMVAIDQLTQHSIFLNNGKLQMYGKTSDVVNAYLGAEKAESLICFNVKNKPRKCHSNQLVRFIEFRFERELPVFNVDEDFQFIARVKANADITDIRTSMTIFANDGTPVGSCFGPAFADFTEGCVVEFRVILPQPRLAPGMYYCGVSVGKGDHITGHVDCDVVLDTLTFEVRPESGDSGTLSLWPRGWGQIVFAPLNQKILLTNE